MTILYQINVYETNKVEYNVDEVIKIVYDIENEFVKEIVYGVNTYKGIIRNYNEDRVSIIVNAKKPKKKAATFRVTAITIVDIILSELVDVLSQT